MKNKKYHTVGTFPKSNRKIAERDEVRDTRVEQRVYIETVDCQNLSKIQ